MNLIKNNSNPTPITDTLLGNPYKYKTCINQHKIITTMSMYYQYYLDFVSIEFSSPDGIIDCVFFMNHLINTSIKYDSYFSNILNPFILYQMLVINNITKYLCNFIGLGPLDITDKPIILNNISKRLIPSKEIYIKSNDIIKKIIENNYFNYVINTNLKNFILKLYPLINTCADKKKGIKINLTWI